MASYVTEHSAGDIIANTFRIYGRNLVPLFLVYFLPVFPFDLVAAVGMADQDFGLAFLGDFLSFAAGIFAYGAMTAGVSDVCLGNRPSVIHSYTMLGRVIGRYLGTYILILVILIISFLPLVILMFMPESAVSVLLFFVLLVPGLCLSVLLMFVLPVVVIERRGPLTAIKRSIALGKGSYLRNLAVFVLAILVVAFAAILIVAIFTAIAVATDLDPESFWFYVVLSVLWAPLVPLGQIPLVLLYYDMRVRKEYFDGAALAQDLFT